MYTQSAFLLQSCIGKKCQTVPLKLQTNKQTNKQKGVTVVMDQWLVLHSRDESHTRNETCYLCISVLFKFSLQKDSINNNLYIDPSTQPFHSRKTCRYSLELVKLCLYVYILQLLLKTGIISCQCSQLVPVCFYINAELLMEAYKQRLTSVNTKHKPALQMCLASIK